MTAGVDDREAIRKVVADAAQSQSDVDALMALHTEDAIIVNIAGRRVLGTEAFRAAMDGALRSPLAQVTTTVDVEDIRFVRDDVAIVSCVKHVHDEREDATAALPGAGAMTYVMAREPDGWHIALAQTTPIAG
jgi:uncharacterized protein (TIGR02246 family)